MSGTRTLRRKLKAERDRLATSKRAKRGSYGRRIIRVWKVGPYRVAMHATKGGRTRREFA